MAASRKTSRKPAAKRSGSRGNPAKARVSSAPPKPAPVTARDWIGAARLRTLPLAISPILVGTGAAIAVGAGFHWVLALCCLVVAVSLQIAVNFANDYSDGVRGTDDHRVGPTRLTASGRVAPRAVLIAALLFFGIAAVTGLAIVIRTQFWWLLAVGAVCIVAAWFYTGGKRPYGYFGLGELFVFVFFGPVAVIGTTFVQAGSVPQESWVPSIAVGALACGVLVTNNLRDIDQDRVAGKRTLTVLIGKRASQVLYTVFMLVPFAVVPVLAVFYPVAWLSLIVLLATLSATLIVWTYRTPRELIVALQLSSLASLAWSGFILWAYVA
ncbi:1,4-dihydroxy-2-naphthoate polyprenyltransferase [Microbacterium sp. KSW4-11]|uniref:1,4-dihydroxy-2-naphthoate octaprenyltransferase n=1 Tax=Microbacterium gawkjiense TaxID=3067309 RepID=A0ABU3G6W4_9MICO|nr:1,4-dihydroxy-2-naphthoate polyprenyltransferase [Microbacterium sp. KSW4-11]MDT3315553.1 1,4-dihydroxy-2-naphthoate polyprenyltransferase [Microbacterium sp. KSW4-11]